MHNIYAYLLNIVLDAPSFLQRMAEHTGVTCPKALAQLMQLGLDSGDLKLARIGAGKDARLFVSNGAITRKGMDVSRLVRDPEAIRRRSMEPSGSIMGRPLSAEYSLAVNYLSQQWFRPNASILATARELVAKGDYFDPRNDRMDLLCIGEFNNFGEDEYLLPMFPDSRYRIYTDSSGIASYQGGDMHRAICDFAEAKAVTDDDIHYALAAFEAEYGVTESNYREIISNPAGFIVEGGFGKKPWCTLRHAFAVDEMIRLRRTAVIFQQDQTNSGGALYAWLTGDRSLARLTNFLPSSEKQDLYGAAGQLVEAAGLLPVEAAGETQFTSRQMGKAFIIPMIYGAANASQTKGLFLKDAQNTPLSIIDDTGCYIPGSLESIPADKLNPKHIEFLRGLGWAKAVRVGSQIASAYEQAMFGSARVKGLTSRLRPAMVAIKAAARATHRAGGLLQWTSPSGCSVTSRKFRVDTDADLQTVDISHDGGRNRISFAPVIEYGSEAAAPPNVIHSLDASVVHKVAVRCAQADIALAPIHDSFGTHVRDARQVKDYVRDSICEIPQDFLDTQILGPAQVQTLNYDGLDINEFRKAEHFLG